MPQHELEHCDICKKLNAKGVIACINCDTSICKHCSESKENYLVENVDGEPLCNYCADFLEAQSDLMNEEILEL